MPHKQTTLNDTRLCNLHLPGSLRVSASRWSYNHWQAVHRGHGRIPSREAVPLLPGEISAWRHQQHTPQEARNSFSLLAHVAGPSRSITPKSNYGSIPEDAVAATQGVYGGGAYRVGLGSVGVVRALEELSGLWRVWDMSFDDRSTRIGTTFPLGIAVSKSE